MKGILNMKPTQETRRQFVRRGSVLIAVAALMHPAGSFAEQTVKSGSEKNREKQDAVEISPVEDLMREHGVLARILLIV